MENGRNYYPVKISSAPGHLAGMYVTKKVCKFRGGGLRKFLDTVGNVSSLSIGQIEFMHVYQILEGRSFLRFYDF